MRIAGEWGRFDAPYLEAVLVCEKLNIQQPVKLLIDTGASATHILDSDAKRLKIDFSQITQLKHGTTGIGGVVDTFVLPSVKLYFRTAEGVHEESFQEIFVLRHQPKNPEEEARIRTLPSLLGRDFLNRYELVLDRRKDRVTVTDEDAP